MVALFLPVAVGAVYFAFQIRAIEEDVLEANARILALVREIVDSTSGRIDRALTNIRRDPVLRPLLFMEHPLDIARITEVGDAHRSSLISKVDDPFLVDILVYFSSPRILFTRGEVFIDTRTFYSSFFEEPGLDHDEWLVTFSRDDHFGAEMLYREIIYRGVPRSVLELRYALPSAPRIRSRGVVAALIDREAIGRLIADQLIPQGGLVLVATADGSVVVDAYSPEYVGMTRQVLEAIPAGTSRGVEYLPWSTGPLAVAYERSRAFGWIVAVAVPRHVFFQQSQQITTLFVIVAAIVMLFGIPISLLLAYRTSRPLVAISDLVRDGVVRARSGSFSRDASGLGELSESVYQLTQRHASLRTLMEEQKPFVRQVIIDRLLRGDFPTENELHATLRHYDVEMSAPAYGVFCVFVDGYYDEASDEIVYEFVVKSTLVKDQLEAVLPPGSLVHGVSLNRIAVVVSLSSADPTIADRELHDTVDRVARLINSRNEVRCLVVRGAPVDRLTEVPESLRVAMSAMRSMSTDGSMDASNRERYYYYPADLESRVVSFVEAGRVEELRGLLETIRAENLERRSLAVPMLKGLADEIEGTRNKVLASVDPPERGRWPANTSELSIEEYIVRQLDGLLGLAEGVAEQDGPYHRHKRAILEFVNGHFTESDMGLKRLALEFSFSEVYLSYLFRQIAGTTFSAYLEQLRMDEAANLLRSTRMTVDEIARHTGYASADVFRRAFKRRYGVSPSSFVDSPILRGGSV